MTDEHGFNAAGADLGIVATDRVAAETGTMGIAIRRLSDEFGVNDRNRGGTTKRLGENSPKLGCETGNCGLIFYRG